MNPEKSGIPTSNTVCAKLSDQELIDIEVKLKEDDEYDELAWGGKSIIRALLNHIKASPKKPCAPFFDDKLIQKCCTKVWQPKGSDNITCGNCGHDENEHSGGLDCHKRDEYGKLCCTCDKWVAMTKTTGNITCAPFSEDKK